MTKTKVINFYGGPCSGKSTAAAGLFYKMKLLGYKVELTDEFAKECVWEGNIPMLRDQLWILAHQHRKILRLSEKVDYIITDSPVLLSPIYREAYGDPLYTVLIDKLAIECYEMYDNINFMLSRPRDDFEEDGRAQDEVQSVQIDLDILKQFKTLGIPYTQIEGPDNASVAYDYLVKKYDTVH
jgi:hypothetical protein